ncbi:hypothetical protein CSC94_06575 [Zhengella mangrovi]|uniref:Porin n=1 Tax=Zhengella mangrovi TaxID=1982044 RepID=A0A2G1QSX3_9HYPH|nr:porin [Zhengella mangrovi]PHP68308.1 hypothetical protein CSC94_06575 [Zhengella mangrovi]
MNIKSLLLGSAAAMVAASAAQAADAIVYEPEPVEYVRVCDAYGAGFFYIPGTETCLSINGYVRMQVGGHTRNNTNDVNSSIYGDAMNDGYVLHTRARLNVDARSDTEWGTLRSLIRVQGQWGTNGDGAAKLDQALIELGGLRMGYTESAWSQTQNGGASNWGSHSDTGLYYGYQQRHLIAYTFGLNGMTGTISLEHDDASANASNWTPDVVGKLAYNAGWGAVWAKVAYDESMSGVAASVGTQFNVPNMGGDNLRLIGYYADRDNAYGVASGATNAAYGAAKYSILASYSHVFSNTFSASVGFQYNMDHYMAGTKTKSGVDSYVGELSMIWTPVQNFEVRSEIAYQDDNALNSKGTVSGYVRFTRYF